MIFTIISLLIRIVLCKGDYCGENKIPFGIEVYPNAQPLLHCSRPSCFERRYADCDDRARRKSCESNDSWVGGFEKGHGNHEPLYVLCCEFEGLADHSSPLYQTIIKPGQYFEGEEQAEEETDTVVSFDVITNFKMIRSPNLSIFYEMTVRRLRCYELPPVDKIKRIVTFFEKENEIWQATQSIPVILFKDENAVHFKSVNKLPILINNNRYQ